MCMESIDGMEKGGNNMRLEIFHRRQVSRNDQRMMVDKIEVRLDDWGPFDRSKTNVKDGVRNLQSFVAQGLAKILIELIFQLDRLIKHRHVDRRDGDEERTGGCHGG